MKKMLLKGSKFFRKNKKAILFFLLAYFFIFLIKTIYSFSFYSFGQDLARDLSLMGEAISNKKLFIAYGPKASVANFYLLPAYYQINLLISYLTKNHYLSMSFFVIFFESFTPIILYLILRKLKTNKLFSLALSFIYLISPSVMTFSSFAWNPNTIPFLSLLVVYLWILYFQEGKKNSLILIPVLLFLAINFHLQAFILFLSFLIFFVYIFWKKKADIKYFFYGFLLCFLIFLPYLITELNNNWPNTRSILNYFTAEHNLYFQRVSKLDYLFNFFPAFFERVLFHDQSKFLIFGRIIYYLGFICFLKIAIKKKKIHLLLFIYFLSIFLMLRVYKGDKIDYYMSILFVLPIFLLAYISKFYKRIAALVMILISFIAGRYYSTLKPFNELKNISSLISLIEEKSPAEEIRVLIHEDDDINTFVYLLNKETNLKINQNSLYLLEILPEKMDCNVILNRKACLFHRGSCYSNLLLEKTKAKRLTTFKEGFYCVNFWKLESNEHNVDYDLYNYNFEYGTDVLNKELYEH